MKTFKFCKDADFALLKHLLDDLLPLIFLFDGDERRRLPPVEKFYDTISVYVSYSEAASL